MKMKLQSHVTSNMTQAVAQCLWKKKNNSSLPCLPSSKLVAVLCTPRWFCEVKCEDASRVSPL